MLIWLPIALLTGVAVLAVLLPLGSRSRARDEGGDVAFYRARLTEIEGDAARGLIDDTLIIKTGDHGEMAMSHGGMRQKNFNCECGFSLDRTVEKGK